MGNVIFKSKAEMYAETLVDELAKDYAIKVHCEFKSESRMTNRVYSHCIPRGDHFVLRFSRRQVEIIFTHGMDDPHAASGKFRRNMRYLGETAVKMLVLHEFAHVLQIARGQFDTAHGAGFHRSLRELIDTYYDREESKPDEVCEVKPETKKEIKIPKFTGALAY